MDFEDTQQEAAFRQEARTWLDKNARRKSHPNETWASTLTDKSRGNIVKLAREFQIKKYQDGWACLHWPKEYGGRGCTSITNHGVGGVVYRTWFVPPGFTPQLPGGPTTAVW